MQQAYRFYPKGVSEFSIDKYFATEQYLFLRQTVDDSYAKNLETWNVFLLKLRKTFAGSHLTAFDYLLPHNERSFPVCITLTKQLDDGETVFRNMVFHLSALINYYAIYQTDPYSLDINKDASFVIDKEFKVAYESLLSIAKETFPTFSLFPANQFDKKVPDVMYDGIGIMDSVSQRTLFDFEIQMNNYHAFFSSKFYYNR